MEASHYQKAVYQHLANGDGNSAVIAVAGSGKTTTAIEGIGHVPAGTSVLLGAFNVSIRDEFKDRGNKKGYKDVTYVNYNGFGWGLCLRNLKHKPELDRDKTRKIMEFVVFKPRDEEFTIKMWKWMPTVERLVSLFKSLALMTPDEADRKYDEILDHYNIDEPEGKNFRQCVIDVFRASIEHQAHYDFDDQKFMPIYFDLPIPKYDLVILDEFQDTCPIELALMTRAGDQICGLGDPDQAIYGFKGATPDAFAEYIRKFNAKELPLSICYRCPKSVIRAAQAIVPRIEWAPGAIEGTVGYKRSQEFEDQVQDKDFVLCRTTEPLVKAQIRFTKLGRKSKVRGRDFSAVLTGLINRVSKSNGGMPIADFITALLDYQIERTQQLTNLRREREIEALEDRCATIRALADNTSRVSDVHDRMKEVFTDSPHEGIDLMTCHKSKGLQAKNVWVLRPDLLPHPRSKDREWMMAEEKRLKYVTITRSEENLFWVDPK